MKFLPAASFAAIALACSASPALAGEVAVSPARSPEERPRDEIIVTGTRIALAGIADLEPTVSIDQAYLQSRNLTNIADALNELPGFRASDTPDGVQERHGQGVNFANAFGLGSNRTLTLVNGRRVVSSNLPSIFGNADPGSQVDLNMIPTILVKRVDRVAIGGAPIYGSEAIAGTVNIILRDDISGPELSATTGMTERGDNFRINLSGAYGAQFADGRGHLTLAASYDKVKGVRQNARRFYRDNILEVPNLGIPGTGLSRGARLNGDLDYDVGPADGMPGTVLVRDATIPFLTEGGLVFGGPLSGTVQFDPQGNLVPFNRGISFGPFTSGGDGFRLNNYGQITSDLTRISVNLLADYQLSDDVRLFVEAQHFRSRADELVDQPNFNALLFSGVSGPLLFTAGNPFLTDQARNLLLSNGMGAFFLSRADADLGDPTGYARSRITRGVLGLDGDFALGGKRFGFEVSATYGQTRFIDHDQQIDQQRFINAINVTRDGSGAIVCDPAPLLPAGGIPLADPACRPLNLFGAGAPSAEARDYVLADVRTRSRLEQFVFNANVGGSPFAIFGNAAGFNLGFEHRSEKARFTPDRFQQLGLGRSSPFPAVSGGFRLDELFGELFLPLITPENKAPIYRLDMFARGRTSHNSINGSFTSWSAGGRFQPVRAIELRGNFTRSFRAPAIAELFSPLSTSREVVPDLCAPGSLGDGPSPEIRARNCAAFLGAYPDATPLLASVFSVPSLQGGDPGLANERADSFTFGIVLRPGFAPGLTISADYLDIRVRDPIAFLSVTELASACFDNPDFDLSDPAHGNAYCSAIDRDATGQVVSDPLNPAVRSGFRNGKRIAFSGIQGSLSYATGLDRIGLPGSLSAQGELLYVRRRVQDLTGVNRIRLDGIIGDPEFRAQLRLGYAQVRWGLTTSFNYTGAQLFSRFARGPSPGDTREIDQLDAFITIDANLFVEPTEGMRINLSVTNLTNRNGQKYFGALIPGSINDPLGRRFAVSVARQF